jgi:membrane-anchored mycosin MYCP
MRVRRALVAATALGCAASGPVVVAAPAYAVDQACESVDATTPPGDTGLQGAPYTLLGMKSAQDQVARFAPAAGEPVRVAVVSSGVRSGDGAIPMGGGVDLAGGAELIDAQGTEIAGLVAGAVRADGQPVGVAPGAQVVDVRVYTDQDSNDPGERPSTPALANGLSWVADRARELHIEVAVVPFGVRRSADLRRAVRAVQRAGVVLVAATGDRPDDGTEFAGDFDEDTTDEDAGPVIFPAGYPKVVAVNSTGTGDPAPLMESVLKNSRTSVAAPSYDSVSYGLNGHTCLVQPASTGAAAGVVAGVLALLRQRFPDDRPAQTVARLVNTADGTTDDPTPLTGAGVIQPYEALTRPLAPDKAGDVERTVVHADTDTQATAPEPADDLLASTRENAVWWGLIGGGLLVVVLMLRPVLARRRRA